MEIIVRVNDLPSRKHLFEHSFIRRMKKQTLSAQQVQVVLGQWFHPLHYFPSFVGRFIGIAPSLAIKTLMSKIMWQELGEGDISRAHETLFAETMMDVGFARQGFVSVAPLPATARLVAAYAEKSASDYLASLGYLYATESADLLMVAAIGAAVRKNTGATRLPWVDVHIRQEPDHTDCVDGALVSGLTSDEETYVLASADAMFTMWCDFFTEIERSVEECGAAAIA